MKFKKENGGIRPWIKVGVAATLAFFLTYAVTSAFNLSAFIKYPLMIALCLITSFIVSIRPRLLLNAICLLLWGVGIAFVVLSPDKEFTSGISWDLSILGTGLSLIALAMAIYALITETRQEKKEQNLTTDTRKLPDSKKGYLWLEETEKYQCEYCLHSGKHQYYKTLGGIKRHIANKHAKSKFYKPPTPQS